MLLSTYFFFLAQISLFYWCIIDLTIPYLVLNTYFWLCINQQHSEVWYHCGFLVKGILTFICEKLLKRFSKSVKPKTTFLDERHCHWIPGTMIKVPLWQGWQILLISCTQSYSLVVVARNNVLRRILNPNLGWEKKKSAFLISNAVYLEYGISSSMLINCFPEEKKKKKSPHLYCLPISMV